jgi:hypothetical protein
MMLYREIECFLVSCIELVRRAHTWEQGPLYLSTTPWSLLTNSIHETMDHSICLCNIMVSSHQSHTWDQGLLYLPKQHHGLFSPTLFMRPWTTLSVYTTSWSLYRHRVVHGLMNRVGEKKPWCCRQIEWPLFSCMGLEHHGLFSPITYMRPGTTLSVYTTPWSLLTNSMHETKNHSISLYNIMVSSHETMVLHRHRVLPVLMYGIGRKRPWCCIGIEWSMVSWIELVRRNHGVVDR